MKNIYIRYLSALLFFLFLLFQQQKGLAQTTVIPIPDTAFEQELINLGIDSDAQINGQILKSDAAVVSRLIIGSPNILSLEGIQAFVNLDTLIIFIPQIDSLVFTNSSTLRSALIYSDSLKYLDLSNNTTLEYVYCAYVKDYINVDNDTALTYLSCEGVGGQGVDSIDVSTNIALKHLILRNNYNLRSIDVSNNLSLVNLNISCCKLIDTLDVTNNLLLEGLFATCCQLGALDVTNNLLLKELVCREVQLRTIDLSHNPLLTFLDISLNPLSSLDVSNQPLLEKLYCIGSGLSTIDLSNNLLLKVLDISNRAIVNPPLRYNQISTLDLSHLQVLERLDCSHNGMSRLVLPHTNFLSMSCYNNFPTLHICVPDSAAAANSGWWKDYTATYVEDCFPRAVHGRVVIDSNNNCILDSLEQGVINQLIKFEGVNHTFYYSTHDSIGNYTAYLDTGWYQVTAIPSSPYWQFCPDTQRVYIDSNYTLQTLNWSLQSAVLCPLLTVDVSAPFLRKTGGGSAYTVSYCNQGTATAPNAYVEVLIDTALQVLNTSIPIASQTGRLYTFNLGNLGVGQCGDFRIQVLVDSTIVLGQTHCTEAHIYPDSICIPNLWSGANIRVSGQCVNDSVQFSILNTGSAMQQPLNYYIVEDNIMMRQGIFQLGVSGIKQVSQLATAGHTYRILAQQEAGYPTILGYPLATAVVEGCVLDSIGAFNVGFVTQLPNGNGSPSIAVDCQQGISAYDPNDKAAQPKGYGNGHFIEQNTTIDYKIRFQNTGNDTAFLVVVRDTISPFLDPATLVMGASSHPYTWTLSHEGILEVFFKNIMLPDSNINEPASHGFFKYKIQQQEDNPLGTIINNRAAIYFDYNPPIITNTTYHTVGKDFILLNLSVGAVLDPRVEVKVYPNPFHQQTTIAIEGQEYQHLKLRIIDVTGRTSVVKEVYSKATLQLSKDNLQTGVYFYTLEGDGQLINTGKIVVQ